MLSWSSRPSFRLLKVREAVGLETTDFLASGKIRMYLKTQEPSINEGQIGIL